MRGRADIDLHSRLAALQTGEGVEAGVRARVLTEARRLRRLSRTGEGKAGEGAVGILLALAYPERVGRRRADGGRRYELVNGSGALLPDWSLLRREEYIAVADVDGVGTDIRIHLASPVSRQDLTDVFADRLLREDQVHWDPHSESVVGRRVLKLGSLVLGESPLKVEENRLREALLGGIRAMGLESLPWSSEARVLKARSEWLRSCGLVPVDWPDLSDAALMEDLPRWLGPWLGGMSCRSDLSALDLRRVISARFEHQQLGELDRLAPVTVLVPSGSRIKIEYSTGAEPALSVKLQEMLGETRTPTVAGGRVKVVLHLLSPAGRPLAVTQDLPSFWKNVYPEVRKEMRGRYPKHYWPENPLTARPAKRTRKPA
jgi:ATP-dependent helicase HrpB